MDEQSLLKEIARRFRPTVADVRRGVRVGSGDDAAVVKIGRTEIVLTADAMVEGIDFDLNYFRWSDVGYKAVSAAVSDLYACGSTPSALLVTAGIPTGSTPSRIRELMNGLAEASVFHQAPIVGGDLSAAPKLFLDVCAVGRLAGKFKSRAGARPGDSIFLSGPVGASRAALHLFQKRRRVPPALRRAHLRPLADRSAGLRLAKDRSVTAMMDVSDGLLIDLSRLCESSGVRAGILPGQVPCPAAARKVFRAIGKNPVEEAALGGEDYVLLFTVRPPVPAYIERGYFRIGRILPKDRKGRLGGLLYNIERRPPVPLRVRGFLHRF